jgi:hypothetical protein
MTPSWYARVFRGYTGNTDQPDGALQIIRANQPGVMVLVGAVGPYSPDAEGSPAYPAINAAWLNNCFNEMCQHIGSVTDTRGLPKVDGFAVHAYGREGNDQGVTDYGKNEPHHDVQAPGAATGAWWGFTVYKNWLDVIDSQTVGEIAGSPVWITETNTDTGGKPSSVRYPTETGWYLEALSEIVTYNGDTKRIKSVC